MKRVKNARASYIKEAEKTCKNEPKKFWDIINKIIPCKSEEEPITIIKNNTKLDGLAAADALNKHFTDVGPKLASEFHTQWRQISEPVETQITDCKTNMHEVLQLAKGLDNNKSSAIENLPNKILKAAFIAIPKVISDLMNLFLETKMFPAEWKASTITSIHKTGNKINPNN